MIPQGRRTRTGGLTGRMVGSTKNEEKGRDFTGTLGRRSASDKQQAHDYGSTSDSISLHKARDMPVALKKGPGGASATAASAVKNGGPCNHYRMRAYISGPYLSRAMFLMEATAAAVVLPSWADDNSPHPVGQSDEAHGVDMVHMPWEYLVGSEGRRPCCQEGSRIAVTESSTSILDRAGAVDAGRCADFKVVPYWNGGFMSSVPEALNMERSDQSQPRRSGVDVSNVDFRFKLDLI
jgi:hypothetical protein